MHKTNQRNSHSHNDENKKKFHNNKNRSHGKKELIEGTIRTSASGIGFVDHPTLKDISIRIFNEDLNNAYNKDTVVVEIDGRKMRDDLIGKVKEVKERGKTRYVGEIDTTVSGEFAYIMPDDNKLHKDIKVYEYDSVPNGHKVVVDIDQWPVDMSPRGHIIKDLGMKGENETEMQATVYDNGFEPFHTAEIEAEAQRIRDEAPKDFAEEIEKRRDIRGTTTITIDPYDAKDFDDALSIKKLDNGNYEVGVHIADVSHYVTPGSAIDQEAYLRSFSVYLVDRTIPMLPEVLSNDLCSLNPNEDKLSFSAIFEMDESGKVYSEWFGKTIMHSDHRYSYEDAQKVADGEIEGPFMEEINTLLKMAKVMEQVKKEQGAISFESDEFKFKLDDKGFPIEVYRKQRLPIHHMIEEFMLLANKKVATYMDTWDKDQTTKDKGMMYRVHGNPDPEKIGELKTFLKVLGYDLEVDDEGIVSGKELNRIIDLAHGKPEEELVSTTAIRTMQKAIYSIFNEGHFGLGFSSYTHFTSPIRRYPDLLVHRAMESILTKKFMSDNDVSYYKKAAEQASEQEKAAQEAERDSIKLKQAEFMLQHVGEEFTGVISGMTDWGLFIKIDSTGADGMVRVEDMKDDFYLYEEKLYKFVGEKNGNVYRLGDPVTVLVKEVDVEEKKINLEMVLETE
jgi:ribonuclease R